MREASENHDPSKSLQDAAYIGYPVAAPLFNTLQRFAKRKVTCLGQLTPTNSGFLHTDDVKNDELVPGHHVLWPFYCGCVQGSHE